MPCGQLDKRRGGHRCSSCRKSHMKCDGNSPCSFCRRNGLQCSFPRRSTDVQIVRVFQSPFTSTTSAPSVALTNDSWSFISRFFEATGKLPQSQVLRSPEVVMLGQSDELVNKTLAIVGQVFSSKTATHTLETKERNQMRRLVAAQKRVITQRMTQSPSQNTTVLLLCSLLLAVPDLLLNPTAEGWRLWIAHVRNFTNYIVEQGQGLSQLDGELMRFFQLNDLLGSIPFLQQPLGQDFAAKLQKEAPANDKPGGPASSRSSRPNQVLSLMWRWAVLQERLQQWDMQSVDSDNIEPSHGLEGIEIVCEASSLQASMLQVLLSYSTSPATTDDSYSHYMRWGLICLSQQLHSSALSSLDCELPIMTPECLHEQAISLMAGIESLTAQCLLDVAFFLPLAEAVAPVMESQDDRERLFRFLDTVKQRGFGVADEYRREIQEEWQKSSMMDTPSSNNSPIPDAIQIQQ